MRPRPAEGFEHASRTSPGPCRQGRHRDRASRHPDAWRERGINGSGDGTFAFGSSTHVGNGKRGSMRAVDPGVRRHGAPGEERRRSRFEEMEDRNKLVREVFRPVRVERKRATEETAKGYARNAKRISRHANRRSRRSGTRSGRSSVFLIARESRAAASGAAFSRAKRCRMTRSPSRSSNRLRAEYRRASQDVRRNPGYRSASSRIRYGRVPRATATGEGTDKDRSIRLAGEAREMFPGLRAAGFDRRFRNPDSRIELDGLFDRPRSGAEEEQVGRGRTEAVERSIAFGKRRWRKLRAPPDRALPRNWI